MSPQGHNGFLIAAPQSGSGKTTLTLGLLRALRNEGVGLQPAKAGPDFIDPAFHERASGETCYNLDPWAMRPELIAGLVLPQATERLLVVEGMMGLFDGAASGRGSAADLAEILSLPIVLVVDCAKQSHSIAALVSGFVNFRPSLRFGGVVLNNVGSDRHEAMMREALASLSVEILGVVYRHKDLILPERHLGLVQASEHDELDSFLERAASVVRESIDLAAIRALARGASKRSGAPVRAINPLGQRIAVATDDAFRFSYPHLLKGWREQGAEILPFSPLTDETPDEACDAVYLPGGYPELHPGSLAANSRFLRTLRNAADASKTIYGECGGYMVLGEGLIDANGKRHKMANLLPLVTSFEKRKLSLGYRNVTTLSDTPFGRAGSPFSAHEFHYSTVVDEHAGTVDPLFSAVDARGADLGVFGMRNQTVMGSYMHLIDRRD